MQWTVDQVSLDDVAAEAAQKVQLFDRLHSLRQGAHSERMGERDDALDHLLCVARSELGGERTVDLEQVPRERSETRHL